MVSFPLSRSLTAMIASRCLGGALGGCWAAIKIMVGEMTDKTNQSAAFTGLAVTYRLGQIVGLPLGGFLSHPERNWQIFRRPFWLSYPYALPCFVGAGFAAISAFFGATFLHETRAPQPKNHAKSKSKNYGSAQLTSESSIPSTASLDNSEETPTKPDTVPLKSVLTRDVVGILISTFGMCFLNEILFSVYPLYGYTPIRSGGLGINEMQIGVQMSTRAVLHIISFTGFEPLRRRLGTVRMYQCSMSLVPLAAVFFPFINFLARQLGTADAWPVRVAIFAYFCLWGFCGFAWTCVSIMITDACPSPAAIAAINGLSQMALVFPQAIAPAAGTSFFAYSVKSGIAGGNLIWVVYFLLGCVVAIHSLTLQEPTSDWRLDKDTAEAAEQ